MYCGNCGKQISDGVSFCPECGSKVETVSASKPDYTYHKPSNNKKVITIALVAVVCVVALIITIVNLSKPKYDNYDDVLEVCCDAINKRDESKLDDVIYQPIDEIYKQELIYSFFDELKGIDGSVKFKVDIEDSEHADSEDLQELSDDLYYESGVRIIFDDCYIFDMDSGWEAAVAKIDGRWYVLALELNY